MCHLLGEPQVILKAGGLCRHSEGVAQLQPALLTRISIPDDGRQRHCNSGPKTCRLEERSFSSVAETCRIKVCTGHVPVFAKGVPILLCRCDAHHEHGATTTWCRCCGCCGCCGNQLRCTSTEHAHALPTQPR